MDAATEAAIGGRRDRRIRRTRAALHAALIDLIAEKGYDAVTGQDIIDRADLGRSTFYSLTAPEPGQRDQRSTMVAAAVV